MGKVFSCCKSIDPPFDIKVQSVLESLRLNKNQEKHERMKRILRKRFVSQIVLYEFKSRRVSRRYNILRTLITIGSMVLPTLQTIQTDPKVDHIENYIFWASIGTSLVVMISNGMIQMFSYDKKHTVYHLAVEKMKSTGWQWLERSGRYSKNPDGSDALYEDNWAMFWNDLERIKSLTVGSIYGGDDMNSDGESNANVPTIDSNTDKEYVSEQEDEDDDFDNIVEPKNSSEEPKKNLRLKQLNKKINKQNDDVNEVSINILDKVSSITNKELDNILVKDEVEHVVDNVDNVVDNVTDNIIGNVVDNVDNTVDNVVGNVVDVNENKEHN